MDIAKILKNVPIILPTYTSAKKCAARYILENPPNKASVKKKKPHPLLR